MRLGEGKTKEILISIRREMVKNPDITIFELQDVLVGQYNRTFDKNFLGKLKNKIHRERARRVGKTIGYELACLEDTINETTKILWEIIDNPNIPVKERVSAIRELRSAQNMLFEAMFNAGIFERQLGRLKTEETKSDLTPEQQAAINTAIDRVYGKRLAGEIESIGDKSAGEEEVGVE